MKLQWIILFSVSLSLYLYTYLGDVDLFPFALSDALTLVHKICVPMFDRDFLSLFIRFDMC